MGQKIAFGIGMFANQMFPATWDIYGSFGSRLDIHRLNVGNDLFISKII